MHKITKGCHRATLFYYFWDTLGVVFHVEQVEATRQSAEAMCESAGEVHENAERQRVDTEAVR